MNSSGEENDISMSLEELVASSLNPQPKGERTLKWNALFERFTTSASDTSSVSSPGRNMVTCNSYIENEHQLPNASMRSKRPTIHTAHDTSVRREVAKNSNYLFLRPKVLYDNNYQEFCQQRPTTVCTLSTTPLVCLHTCQPMNVACMERKARDTPFKNNAVSDTFKTSNTPKENVTISKRNVGQLVKPRVCINNANELIRVKGRVSADTISICAAVNTTSKYNNSAHRKSTKTMVKVRDNITDVYKSIQKDLVKHGQREQGFLDKLKNMSTSTSKSHTACLDMSLSSNCKERRTSVNNNRSHYKVPGDMCCTGVVTRNTRIKDTVMCHLPQDNVNYASKYVSAISESQNVYETFDFINSDTWDYKNRSTPNFQRIKDSINSIQSKSHISPKTNESSSETYHISHRLNLRFTSIAARDKERCVRSKITPSTAICEDNFRFISSDNTEYKKDNINYHGVYSNINKSQFSVVFSQETNGAFGNHGKKHQEKVSVLLNEVVTKLHTEKQKVEYDGNNQLNSKKRKRCANTTPKSTVDSTHVQFQHIGYATMMSNVKKTPSSLKNDDAYTSSVSCGDNTLSSKMCSNHKATKLTEKYPRSNQETSKKRCWTPLMLDTYNMNRPHSEESMSLETELKSPKVCSDTKSQDAHLNSLENKQIAKYQRSTGTTFCWIHSQEYGCPKGNIPTPRDCVFCRAVRRSLSSEL